MSRLCLHCRREVADRFIRDASGGLFHPECYVSRARTASPPMPGGLADRAEAEVTIERDGLIAHGAPGAVLTVDQIREAMAKVLAENPDLLKSSGEGATVTFDGPGVLIPQNPHVHEAIVPLPKLFPLRCFDPRSGEPIELPRITFKRPGGFPPIRRSRLL